MGSNMQRQAVPLVSPEPPRVGTGMEGKAVYDSGVLVRAKRSGTVVYVSNTRIVINVQDKKGVQDNDEYILIKYQRTNQDTCYTQKPIVELHQKVQAG